MTSADRIAPIERDHFWFVARDELFTALLARLAPGARAVVDVGCGTGGFAARLSALGHDVVGVEPHLPATLPTGPRFVEGSVEALPLQDASCDVVLARDVLEHVDDRGALTECRRVVRPGGLLLAAVPAWPALWGDRDVVAGHLRRYRRGDLAPLLDGSGFRPTETRGYQFLLFPMFVASRVAGRWRGDRQLRQEERPAGPLNRALLGVNRLEVRAAAVPWLRPPTGSSLVVAAVPR